MAQPAQRSYEKAVKSGIVIGAVGDVVMIVLVFATGSTFGQRCAKVHAKDTPQWQQCVSDLAKG